MKKWKPFFKVLSHCFYFFFFLLDFQNSRISIKKFKGFCAVSFSSLRTRWFYIFHVCRPKGLHSFVLSLSCCEVHGNWCLFYPSAAQDVLEREMAVMHDTRLIFSVSLETWCDTCNKRCESSARKLRTRSWKVTLKCHRAFKNFNYFIWNDLYCRKYRRKTDFLYSTKYCI